MVPSSMVRIPKRAEISFTPQQKPEIMQGTESSNFTSLKSSLASFHYQFSLLSAPPISLHVLFALILGFWILVKSALSVYFVILLSLPLLYRTF